MLAEIAGLPAVSLQPAAGAHGELTALLVAAAYFRDRGEKRTKVLVPDSAHGTNPASAAMAGFDAVTVKSTPRRLRRSGRPAPPSSTTRSAVFMITNPNTLGMFEPQIAEIAELVHDVGGLIYLDGANMNAILGITRPGDFGADMMHFNPHKTFSGPHGGGGPGAGPIARDRKAWRRICRRRSSCADGDRLSPRLRSAQVDRPRAQLLRQRRRAGPGLLLHPHARARRPAARRRKRRAQRQLSAQPREAHSAGAAGRPLHARVRRHRPPSSRPSSGVSAMDIAKRLLDYGFHAPTVYFPLIVREAMMIEPTETESKETLDAFAETLFRITRRAADLLHEAPHTTPISRPDEVRAARQPIVAWTASKS